jgi:hypothetical protein
MPERIPTFTASRWTPLEVSLVNIAADPGARLRALEGVAMPEIIETADTTVSPPAGVGGAAPKTITLPTQVFTGSGTWIKPAIDQAMVERERVTAIMRCAKTCRIPEATATRFIDDGTALQDVLDAMLTAAARRDEADAVMTRSHVSGGADHDDPAAIASRMQAALLHRADPGRYELPPEGGRVPRVQHGRDAAQAARGERRQLPRLDARPSVVLPASP